MIASHLEGPEKAAVLLLSLGTEAASQVMRHLDEDEVRRVSQAIARIRHVDCDRLDEVNRDFKDSLVRGLQLSVNGREFAFSVVNRALSDQEARASTKRAEILADLEQSASGDLGLASVLHGVSAQGLARMLEGEHPQVTALILAHVGAATAADAVALLPEVLQADVVERLARLESVPTRLAAELGIILGERVKGLLEPAGSALGGPKAVAEVMNHVDKAIESRIFDELERIDGELVHNIRSLMFTFEDCMRLDDRSLQSLLKEVAREDLILSLKTANPVLRDKIFSNVSSRAAEILKEDMSATGPVRLKDVETAQARVIATLRELEAEGKVVIAGGGKDDVLV